MHVGLEVSQEVDYRVGGLGGCSGVGFLLGVLRGNLVEILALLQEDALYYDIVHLVEQEPAFLVGVQVY